MDQKYCLNCSEKTVKNYCSNCGQKTDTHRIKVKSFLMHDVLHGVWHLEKGILFTIKEAFLRPGQAALDYIYGKRIRYYNVFYLCLLLVGLNIILTHAFHEIHPQNVEAFSTTHFDLSGFLSKNLKIFMLSTLPVFAINALLIFRKLNLNIAEHFIISGMTLLGMLVLSLPFVTMSFLNNYDIPYLLGSFEMIFFLLILLFPAWSYYDATKRTYRFFSFLWRISILYLLLIMEFIVFIWIIVVKLSDSKNIYFNI